MVSSMSLSQCECIDCIVYEILINFLCYREKKILDLEKSFSPECLSFYSSFVCLSCNCITANAAVIPKSQVNTASNACLVLLQYLLHVVQNFSDQNVLSRQQLVSVIQGFVGEEQTLNQMDITSLTAVLKTCKLPDELMPSQTPGFETASLSTPRLEEERETKRIRVDHSCESFLEQLMTPVMKATSVSFSENKSTEKYSTGSLDSKTVLMSKNLQNLQLLGGMNSLLDFVMTLSSIEPFVQTIQGMEEGAPLKLPYSLQDANNLSKSVKVMSKDLDIVSRILSLPLLEPSLKEDRLSKIMTIVHSSLYISASLTTAASIYYISGGKSSSSTPAIHREDSEDGESVLMMSDVIDSCLSLHKKVLTAFKNNLRVSTHFWQNSNLFSSWLLLSTLKFILALNPAKISGSRGDAASSASHKARQGYTIQCLAIATHAVYSLNQMLDDLKVETPPDNTFTRLERLAANLPTNSSSLQYNKFGCYSAWQRLEMLLSSVSLAHFLFSLTSVCYRKAGVLRASRLSHNQPQVLTPLSTTSSTEVHAIELLRTPSAGGHTGGHSDIEEECCFSSDDSSREEDSEPILGQLFREERTDFDSEEVTKRGAAGYPSPDFPSFDTDRSHPKDCDRRDPQRHVALASSIIESLNANFVCSDLEAPKLYLKVSMTETQMIVISNIIKDLDRESSSGNSNSLYQDFSRVMTSFVHNLIATDVLSDSLQVSLLTHLGVSPSSNSLWPLYIPPRTLSVMTQVLLLKQRREKDELRSDVGTTCLMIWQNLLRHLKKLILDSEAEKPLSRFSNSSESTTDFGDINVEHAQVLLFLFHDMKLLHRKQILLTVCQIIVEVTPVVSSIMRDDQIHFLGRLLHFFEYMMRNLYEAPHSLVEQIDHNLFKSLNVSTGHSKRDKENNKDISSTKLFFHCREAEDSFSKYSALNPESEKVFNLKPRFYHLFNVDFSTPKDAPKLDGMSLNFVLNGLDGAVKYTDLYDSLLQMLLISNQVDKNQEVGRVDEDDVLNHNLSFFGVCATQYAFKTAWRIILQMPPSLTVIQSLTEVDQLLETHRLVHAIVWIPRMSHNKWFYSWMKDALVKMSSGVPVADLDLILQSVSSHVTSLDFSVRLLTHYFNHTLGKFASHDDDLDVISKRPTLLELFCIEALLLKTYSHVESSISNMDSIDQHIDEDLITSSSETAALILRLLSPAFEMTHLFYKLSKENILRLMDPSVDSVDCLQEGFSQKSYYDACSLLIQIANGKNGKSSSLSVSIAPLIPIHLKKSLDKWNSIAIDINPLKNDLSASETLVQGALNFHYSNFLSNPIVDENDHFDFCSVSLKHVCNTLIKFVEETFLHATNTIGPSLTDSDIRSPLTEAAVKVMIPLHLDASLESFSLYGNQVIQEIYHSLENEEFLSAVYFEALSSSYKLLTDYTVFVKEKILIESLKFMESLLSSSAGQLALEKYFCDSEDYRFEERDIVFLFMSAANTKLSSTYSCRVLRFFAKLFEQTEKNPESIGLVRLCTSLTRITTYAKDSDILTSWLEKVLFSQDELSLGEAKNVNQESRQLLQSLATFIVKDSSPVDEDVAYAFLSALIPMQHQILSSATEAIGFPDLMVIMTTLAGTGGATGHLELIKALGSWLESCRQYLSQKDVIEKLEGNNTNGRHHSVMESVCYMLSYLSDVYSGIKLVSNDFTRSSSPFETDNGEYSEEDYAVEESVDEESDDECLHNRMCTFTLTQKEFMNQHWYHCHTCKMTDRVGVCTVCAMVCHRDHDVTYAKYGSFFCDCGARDNGQCQALVKRQPSVSGSHEYRLSSTEGNFNSASQRKSSLDQSKSRVPSESVKKHEVLSHQLEANITDIKNVIQETNIPSTVLSLLQFLTPAVVSNCRSNSSLGASCRAKKAMSQLHALDTKLEMSETLMVPTLGSQEGAFENVKLSYTGDQGQIIRQLISSNVIRRVAMTALSSLQGKRQHLAVSHEKGKITLLQLSALLRQSDSAMKKLTLTRLASAPVPFTALSISSNSCNEDLLAVCGLRDCHVLTFSSSGTVTGHMILHLQLEPGNNLVKTLWLPGSQTELAVVATDFVKVFDLSISCSEPQYTFLVPSGKVRDVTFVCPDTHGNNKTRSILLMSSTGYVYWQTLDEESSARHGPFYVTNVLDLNSEVKFEESSSGFISGGGVSIYYSHSLQLLFLGFLSGKTMIAPLISPSQGCPSSFTMEMKSTGAVQSPSSSVGAYASSSSSSKAASPSQVLCQWTEVAGHPGLVFAMSQKTNNPFVLMIKPNTIICQEIKFVSQKTKITDMVGVRHQTGAGEDRTTLILLCEDGSLRIFMASMDSTNFWIRPNLNVRNMSSQEAAKSSRKKKGLKTNRSNSQTVSQSSLPVDFFEHCSLMTDVDFGGADILQIYNVQQVKNRLNTAGMYIASTKSSGFSLDVINNDPNMVMVGVRILVGSQDVSRAPSFIEIFGRSTLLYLNRSRWYDIPFTRDESLKADKKLTINFGPSNDPNTVTMVDSVKVYGKSKDTFVWPDDDIDEPSSSANGVSTENELLGSCQLSILDRFLRCSLEVLGSHFAMTSLPDRKAEEDKIDSALEVATQFLNLPFNNVIEHNIKSFLSTLHSNRISYYNHRDSASLNYVIKTLTSPPQDEEEMDGETFYRLISITRSIASNRPANLIKFCDCFNAALATPVNIVVVDSASEAANMPGSRSCSNLTAFEGNKTPSLLIPNAPQRSVSFTENQIKGPSGSAFITYISDVFWTLFNLMPDNPILSSIPNMGLINLESTVHAIIEIIHAFTLIDTGNLSLASQLYLKLLLCPNNTVSFAAKQSITRILKPRSRKRKVLIPSPARSQSPPKQKAPASQSLSSTRSDPQRIPSQGSLEVFMGEGNEVFQNPYDNAIEQQVVEAGGGVAAPEALLPQFNPILDLAADADDEAMVEFAIALSLQEQGAAAAVPVVGQQGLDGQYSDVTASPAASDDDDGSTAATDGSTLRTSPVANEPEVSVGGAGSESGGSPVESIIGEQTVSGRSSAYGEDGLPSRLHSREIIADTEETIETSDKKLHFIRLSILEKLVDSLPEVRDVGGVNCIPFMQVVLMLSGDLDNEGERDRQVLTRLLNALLMELDQSAANGSRMANRTKGHEVKLIIMRLLSILMSRVKSSTPSLASSVLTAGVLINSNVLDLCLEILVTLLSYWKDAQLDIERSSSPTSSPMTLLKAKSPSSPPDMSPFFLKQYVKGHSDDVFELYPQLLSEMVLRLPYQIKKISNSQVSGQKATFCGLWLDTLCEYMMIPLTPYVKKQVRKLLSYICGSKDQYRQIRDFHALESHLREIRKSCKTPAFDGSRSSSQSSNIIISLSYDETIVMIEHLKACNEIASNRTSNWQKYCLKDKNLLPFFLQISFLLDEGVSPIILYLINIALCPAKQSSRHESSHQKSHSVEHTEKEGKIEGLNSKISCDLLTRLDSSLLTNFVKCFLLESNSTSLRWQTHALLYNLYKNFDTASKERVFLLETLWSLWPNVSSYGRKSAQFVDLLGFTTLKTPVSLEKEQEFGEKAVMVLRQQNQLLMHHSNSSIYNSLQGLVEFDGYFLESEPCLVCSNPEVNFANIKLSSLKVDSRFTTTTQIVKLIGSHTISKISLRITDIKRTKMVKTLTVFYNNRSVHSVVELKNKSGIWHKAKRCNLSSAQSEVKIEFPLPIVACNLMIEYSDFYENVQASSETLQCPRCSASVAASPGVCGNCGENVFQCHKCRAINYDEKDPFLCNSCGFCKYAKFDFTLTAKPTCAVDPIENEEDRKKMVQSINNLLEKADRVYKNLFMNKPTLELLLLRIQEHGFIDKVEDDMHSLPSMSLAPQPASSNVPSVTHVNRAIQQIAYKYCSECKSSFDELSKIIQRVLASRKELVDYDNKQKDVYSHHGVRIPSGTRRDSKVMASLSSASGRCFGCASATVDQCLVLLKALSTTQSYKQYFCSSGLLRDLLDFNLRSGSNHTRQEVRHLLCSLTKDNLTATSKLNNMITDKIKSGLSSNIRMEFSSSVRHEMALLITSIERDDSCWEQGLRCVFRLFLMSINIENPVVLETVTLPCLRLLISLVKPDPAKSSKNQDKSLEQMATVKASGFSLRVDMKKWLTLDSSQSFKSWRERSHKIVDAAVLSVLSKPKAEVRAIFLMEKYGMRWRCQVLKKKNQLIHLNLTVGNWLQKLLFNRFSRTVRVMACSLIEALFQVPSRSQEVMDLLYSCLDDLGSAGEYGTEFFTLFRQLVGQDHWKFYLSLKGILLNLGNLVSQEIEGLNEKEETSLNSDLSQGCALKMMVDLLTIFIEVPSIRKQYKTRLIAFILNGYLSLRKLVVQRTKRIDEAQECLLELLEEMTTGTEAETEQFMTVCIEAVNKCKLDDLRTPVFIFEQLCSIIYPEESGTVEFYITLEKDPQQEDFLQGRMLGNPYSSNDSGMGPLMRDIKNKICTDCELVALLEDDSGMELLVNNKIISLDLPVKDVFKKIWCADNNEADSMRIIYRMRGLMGDATEEFIETIDSKDSQEVDNEVVYRLANRMSVGGGLEVMLQRLKLINDMTPRCRPMLLVLLKLMSYCIKVQKNRRKLIEPQLRTVQVLLPILKMSLTADASEVSSSTASTSTTGQPNVIEQILSIIETICVESSKESLENCDAFIKSCGRKEDIVFLLTTAVSTFKSNSHVLQQLMRVVPLLSLGDTMKMTAILDFFQKYLNFKKFDFEHIPDDEVHFECFCLLVNSIEQNQNGNRLKDLILTKSDIMNDALEYLTIHAPAVKSALLATSEEWKEFTQRPALKYVLRIMTGMASRHEQSQLAISADTVPVIHGLEQVSSDSHVGSLAESLLEALKDNPTAAARIEEVRRQTRDEKKKLAMAVRQKQLGQLGMRTNERGQVTAKSTSIVEDLGEESGLTCNICREGYKFQPNKVLGIYSFTKRCPLEPFEGLGPNAPAGSKGTRKTTIGYSTVTHLNIVHVDCHMTAVRHARGRDEWESAVLQNANTRCNGLIPLWGSLVQESAFASCLARHNTYLQEATGHRDINYTTTIHDLKLLLLKFAHEESFSSESGGGGTQSNIHLVPYLMHMALYVLNTTRVAVRESKKTIAFIEQPPSRWIESAFQVEGVNYMACLFLVVNPPSLWKKYRIDFLKRLLVQTQARHSVTSNRGQAAASSTPVSTTSLSDQTVKEYSVYKNCLVFFALIDGIYSILFKVSLLSMLLTMFL